MKVKVRLLLQRPGIRYLLVGGSVYALELVIIIVAQHLGASAVVAVALSFWIGLMVSFVLQKLFTFRDRRSHHRVLLPQLLAVSALVVFNFGFTIAVTTLLSGVAPAVVARTVALAITTLWNFYLYRARIFQRTEEGANASA